MADTRTIAIRASRSSCTFTRSGTTCTLSIPSPSYIQDNGETIVVSGFTETNVNGEFTVSNLTGSPGSAQTVDYTVTDTGDTSGSGGTQGGHYSSFSSAEASYYAHPDHGSSANLVTDDERRIVEFYGKDWPSGLDDGFNVSAAVLTVDSTRNVIVRAAENHGHGGTIGEGGKVYQQSGDTNPTIGIAISDLVLGGKGRGFTVEHNRSSSSQILSYTDTEYLTIDSMILQADADSSSNYANLRTSLGNDLIVNCVAMADKQGGYGFYNGGSVDSEFFYCGVYSQSSPGPDSGYDGFGSRSGDFSFMKIANCVSFADVNGAVSDFASSGYDSYSDYNASSDTSAPGTTTYHSITTSDFVDSANDDWRPANDSDLADNSKDVSADGCWARYNARTDQTINWSTDPYDIAGNARPSTQTEHSIGPFLAEPAAGGGSALPLIMAYHA